jgi:hypothetical protein
MINQEHASQFVQSWIKAWNAHDLDAIMVHYTDDFEMSSPYIVQRGFDASGTLKGKAAVGAYWKSALDKAPQLKFEFINVLAGTNSVLLNYRSLGGRLAAEVFFFNAEGKVYRAAAHYLD